MRAVAMSPDIFKYLMAGAYALLVYGLAAASLVPVLFGVLVRRYIPLWVVAGAAAIGLALHLVCNLELGGQSGGLRNLRYFCLSYIRYCGPRVDTRRRDAAWICLSCKRLGKRAGGGLEYTPAGSGWTIFGFSRCLHDARHYSGVSY